MRANPGGEISIKSIVGRDETIKLIWDTLEQQSVIKTAERRIGKTTIAKKMLAEPREGWSPAFQDLEQYHSANDFAVSVYRKVDSFLSSRKRSTRRAVEFFQGLGGSEFGGVLKLPKLPPKAWKNILTHSVRDLSEEREDGDDRLVFLWDEVPYMLEHIRDREGEETALEVLDVLRGLRQEYGLRMVITGSVGIHHVLTTLSKKAEASINDLYHIDIPTLEPSDATELATQLIKGENLLCEDLSGVSESIATETDNFPFYIHHVVKALTIRGEEIDAEIVKSIVAKQLSDDHDPWELQHFRKRLDDYYGDDEKTVCLLLDELSVASEALDPNDLLARVKNASDFDDRDRMLELLRLLARDHYLKRDETGAYRFRFTLIQRWWALSRGLN